MSDLFLFRSGWRLELFPINSCSLHYCVVYSHTDIKNFKYYLEVGCIFLGIGAAFRFISHYLIHHTLSKMILYFLILFKIFNNCQVIPQRYSFPRYQWFGISNVEKPENLTKMNNHNI